MSLTPHTTSSIAFFCNLPVDGTASSFALCPVQSSHRFSQIRIGAFAPGASLLRPHGQMGARHVVLCLVLLVVLAAGPVACARVDLASLLMSSNEG